MDKMDLFVTAVHACPTVLTVLILLWLNEGFQKLRDRALFIPWGGREAEDFGGITCFLGEQKEKGGISRD